MSALRLVIGNYNTSSRSLAVWLVLRRAGLAFDLEALDLRDPAGLEQARRRSPRGRLPVLEIGDTIIGEPLAICEYAAERSAGLWPEAAEQRARARAIAAEAVYELADLSTFLPMDMTGRFSPPGKLLRGVQRDLDRLYELWGQCLDREREGGPFLFGRFSVADAFMAPLVARLVTHGIEHGGGVEDYLRAVRELPEYLEWKEMAEIETSGATPATPGRAPRRRPGSTAAPRPASPPERRPAVPSVEEVQPPSRPAARRLFARPAVATTGEIAAPAGEKASAKVARTASPKPAAARAGARTRPEPGAAGSAAEPPAAAARAEPKAPPSSRETSAQRESGADAGPVNPTASEPESPSPPARRRRAASSGPIVKPIGGGIHRRR